MSGTLRDEVGTPVADALLVLTPLADPTMEIPWGAIGSCSDGSTGGGSVDYTVVTDSLGGFCVTGSLPRSEVLIRIVYAGGPLHEGTRSEILWNAHQQPLTLTFAPRPERIDLDGHRVLIFARAIPPPGVSVSNLNLILTGDNNHVLATAQTDPTGSAHFDFASKTMSGPGVGILQVSFPGREDLAAASVTATVTRTVRVRLAAKEQEIRGDPNRGVAIRVQADTSRGPATGGTVEATLDHDLIGAAPIVHGTADLIVRFRPRVDTPSHGISLRFRPDAPYYEPSGAISVAVIATQPSPFLRAIPPLIAAVVAIWLLRGWWRPKRREEKTKPKPVWKGKSSVQVLHASPQRDRWTGKVIDAHDGSPVVDALVQVVVPTFVELDVVAETRTDPQGSFEMVVGSVEKNLRLRVEGEHHGEVDRPLPEASDMVVMLVSRRRQMLDRLVRWARRAGRPWNQEADATPGHVVRVARRQNGEDVAVWAERVEAGAYGPEPVNRRSEKEVRDLEPRGQPLR